MADVDANIDSILAKDAGVRSELRQVRDRGAALASGLFAAHDHPGGAKITKSRGSVDFFYSLDDSEGEGAAAAIEFGHTTKQGKAVPGLNIMRRSAAGL